MTPERVLQHAPLVLDPQARERYFADGFLTVPGYVGGAWLRRLRAVVDAKIEESRRLSASDDQFDLAPDHTAEKPNIRRLRKAVDQHPELWAFAQDPSVVDLIADLLGPDIRFHSSKLNFKWSDGGDAVRWHQDIQAWPHTNFSVLTFGVYLDDTGPEQGPLTAPPLAQSRTGFRCWRNGPRRFPPPMLMASSSSTRPTPLSWGPVARRLSSTRKRFANTSSRHS
jgi:ectoine hydroxylase